MSAAPGLPNTAAKAAHRRSGFTAVPSRDLISALVLSIAYYGGVHVGIALTVPSSPVSTLWPPNAILLTGLLLTPPRTWWLMIAAVFPAHVAAELLLGVPLTMTLLWFVSNVAEGLIGAAVTLRLLGGRPRFDRVRDVSVFLFAAVFLAPLVTSFLDAAFVVLTGWRYSGQYWEIWRIRSFSNALTSLTLAPLIVTWFQRVSTPLRQPTLMQHAEACALLIGLCVTSAAVFQLDHPPGHSAVLVYTPLPFLIWAAVRHGVNGVSLSVAIVALFAVTGLLDGHGPFASGMAQEDALALQVFLILTAASLLLLAASLAELRHAREVALRQDESLKLALVAAEMGTWEWDIGRDRVRWRPPPDGAPGFETDGSWQSSTELLSRVHPDDRPLLVRAINDALERGDGGEFEYRFSYGDSEHRWVTSKGRVIADAKGKPQRMIGVHVDTTHRKNQEMQARAQQEQLTRLSRVFTLGELSGALAHELNQPLTSILINAQAGLREIEGAVSDYEMIIEILRDIASDAKRAGTVIKRLRTLFLRGAAQIQAIDANECIREVLALEHSDLIRRNATTDMRLAADIPPVAADRVQLQQVLLNLIVNACDAMAGNEPGDRRLRIVSARNGDTGIDIEIRDSGHGIDDVDAIFQPFYTTKEHGIGLGLAICHTIIGAHHGFLWASNNATRGATFHIWLPAASAESADDNDTESR